MVRIESRRVAWSAALGAAGILTALTLTIMPMASADPVPPTPDPSQPVTFQPVPADPAAAVPVAASVAATAPPDGVPHLPSPDNLPPGTTEQPIDPDQGHGLSYLRDLWHAVQTQDVSGSRALLLLTQRPMDAGATPPMGMSSSPQTVVPADPAAAPVAPPANSAEIVPPPVQ